LGVIFVCSALRLKSYGRKIRIPVPPSLTSSLGWRKTVSTRQSKACCPSTLLLLALSLCSPPLRSGCPSSCKYPFYRSRVLRFRKARNCVRISSAQLSQTDGSATSSRVCEYPLRLVVVLCRLLLKNTPKRVVRLTITLPVEHRISCAIPAGSHQAGKICYGYMSSPARSITMRKIMY
jgi:hypothetical protein